MICDKTVGAAVVYLTLVSALGAGLASEAPASEVGVTSAVNNGAFGTPPTDARRTLFVGTDLVFEEVIETDVDGQAQILFVDRSSLTISPSARVTIDRFVYDPDHGTGELAINLSQGLLRFVGGALSKREEQVSIATPSATIGIRGGGTLVEVDPETQETIVTFIVGSWVDIVLADGDRRRLTVPGTRQVIPFGAMVADLPALDRSSRIDIGQALSRLEGRSGRSAGAARVPIDDDVRTTEIVRLGSTLGPAGDPTVAGGLVNGEEGAAPSDGAQDEPTILANLDDTVDVTQGIQDTNAPDATLEQGLEGRLMTSPQRYETTSGIRPPAQTGVDAGLLGGETDRIGGTLDGVFRDANTVTFTDPQGNAVTLPRPDGAFSFTALDTGVPGYPTVSGGGASLANGALEYYFGRSDRTPDRGFFVFTGIPTEASGQIASQQQLHRYHVHADPLQGGNLIPFTAPQFGFGRDGAGVSDFFIIEPVGGVLGHTPELGPDAFGLSTGYLQASVSIENTGSDQRSAMTLALGALTRTVEDNALTFGDRIEGTYRTSAQSDAGFLVNGTAGPIPGETSSFFGPNLDAFVIGQVDPSVGFGGGGPLTWDIGAVFTGPDGSGGQQGPASNFTTFGFQNPVERVATIPNVSGAVTEDRQQRSLTGFAAGTAEYFFGPGRSQSAPIISNGFFLDLFPQDNSMLADLFVVSLLDDDLMIYLPFGDGITGATDTYIDGDAYGARVSEFVPVTAIDLVDGREFELEPIRTSALIPSTLAPDTDWLPGNVALCECAFLEWGWWSAADLGSTFIGQGNVHMATWVAGDVPFIAEVPITGTAEYQGHAIGNVVRGPDSYIAAGTYVQEHNFATRESRFQITDFDGMTFRGQLIAGEGAPGFLEATTITSPDFKSVNPDLSGADIMFVRGGADPVGGIVGQFGIAGRLEGSGTRYGAFGTIAAEAIGIGAGTE